VIVLDASALVDYLVDRPEAAWVLDRIDDEDIRTAAHQPAEVLSALARHVRASALGVDAAQDALREAMRLPQDVVVPTEAHMRRAFDLRERIRVTDGLYVALAEERGVPLVTTDRRLARAEPPCEVAAPPGER
jgi:predicted nucleic acid-binding protein